MLTRRDVTPAHPALLAIGARTRDILAQFMIEAVLLAMAVSCGIGQVLGFFPARRAAKLDPIDALRRD